MTHVPRVYAFGHGNTSSRTPLIILVFGEFGTCEKLGHDVPSRFPKDGDRARFAITFGKVVAGTVKGHFSSSQRCDSTTGEKLEDEGGKS